MDLDEARAAARDYPNDDSPATSVEIVSALAARLDTIERRAQQIRDGGLDGVSAWAAGEVVDFLMGGVGQLGEQRRGNRPSVACMSGAMLA